MRKKLFLFAVLSFLIIPVIVSAKESIYIDDYVTQQPVYKWYDGNANWSSSEESPIGAVVDSNLKEGTDYIREYAFTRDRNVNPDDDLDWKDSAIGMSDSGYIWERIIGIGDYAGDIAVRNEIYTYIYVTADDIIKTEGDKDPKFTYTVKMHNNNPNNVMNLFDVTFEREEGEKPGTYKITPVVSPKEGISSEELIVRNTMAIGDYTNGRIYFAYNPGTLTIKEISNGKVIVKYLEQETKKELDYEELKGKVGDDYNTSKKDIKGYSFSKVVGAPNGKYSKNDITVLYYYVKDQKKNSIIQKEGHNDKTKYDIVIPPYTDTEDITLFSNTNMFIKKEEN